MHIQRLKTQIIFFKSATRWARHIFCVYSFKPFNHKQSYASQAFHEYALENMTRAE
jgi:hypothetical protein